MRIDAVQPGQGPQTPWWFVLLEGVAALVIGVLLLTETGATLFTVVVFAALYWLIGGVVDLVMMFVDHRRWGWRLFSGVLAILAAVVVLRDPLWAAVLVPAVLVWILGAAGIVIGAVHVVRAFLGGGLASAILGAVAVLLGGTLLFNTLVATTVLVYAVALAGVTGGILAIVAAFLLRGRERPARRGAGRPVAHA